MISRLVPGTSALCRIVRLIGEGWTGEGGCWALSASTMPHVMRAVQSTMRLTMFPSSNDGIDAKGATQGSPSSSHVAGPEAIPLGPILFKYEEEVVFLANF